MGKENKGMLKVWKTLLYWLVGILVVHLIARILQIKITVFTMLITNLIVLGLILLINKFYTKERFYFEWFGFKRIGWLLVFLFVYIVGDSLLFKTIPSETSLQISLDPLFWLFYLLATAAIPVTAFIGVLLPAMLHNWQTKNVLIKSITLSAFLYSIFQVFLLNDMYGGWIVTIYQIVTNFILGMLCALLYLRSVNIAVAIFLSFIEGFFAIILTHVTPLFGNGWLNIGFFVILLLIIWKVEFRPQILSQISHDFKIKFSDDIRKK